jgi:magnesium transporter
MISIYHKVNDHYEIANDISDLLKIKRENIIWVDILGWDDLSEKTIEDFFDVQIMNAKESVEIEQSARFIEYENHVVSHVTFITQQELNLLPKIVSFTINQNLIITSRDYDFRSFKETSKKVLASGTNLSNADIFLNIIDLRIANDADLVEELTKGIAALSKSIITEKHTSKPLILKLNALRENLMLLMQNCIDKKLLISIIKKSNYISDRVSFELDISVKDLESVIDYIRFNFDRLDYIDSTLNNLITYEQNNAIKLFTIVSLFFMPPMLIASIYGMNYKFMPELEWIYGYPFALLLMLFTVIGTAIYFKVKHWL